MAQCARCDASFKDADGFFSDVGMVCPSCHAKEETADAERFAAADSVGLGSSPLSHSETRTTVDKDGRVVTTTTTTSIDAGPFNAVIRLFRGLFGRKDED